MNLRVLDALRGLAALYVVVFHAAGLLWDAGPPDTPPLGMFVVSLFGFGQQAVLLFFLISGFCIHYRQAQSGATRVDLRRFAWRRFRRLYPSLLVALAVTGVLDWFGAQLSPGIYASAPGMPSFASSEAATSTAGMVVGNLLFQGALLVPPFGADTPLWSLAFEFWYYALYPLALYLFRRMGARRTLLAACALSASIDFSVTVQSSAGWRPNGFTAQQLLLVVDWPIWLIGAAIADAYARGVRSRLLACCGPASVLAVIALACLSPSGSRSPFPHLAWGAALGFVLAYLMLESGLARMRIPAAVTSWCMHLGDISYSLYLLHFPMLVFVGACWTTMHTGVPTGPELMLAGVLCSVVAGWVAWWVVERHFVTRRRVVQADVSRTPILRAGAYST